MTLYKVRRQFKKAGNAGRGPIVSYEVVEGGELIVTHVSYHAGIILLDTLIIMNQRRYLCVMFAGVFISAMFPQSPISHISAQFIQLKYRIPDLMKSCISFLENMFFVMGYF